MRIPKFTACSHIALQEDFRPYYMTANILVGIMNQQPEKGAEILATLTPKELQDLSNIVPQLGEPEEGPQPEDPNTQRQELFTTLISFITKLLDSSSLVLFIDDLHCSDEATLLLLRRMLLLQNVQLFICGASAQIRTEEVQEQPVPLESFFASYEQELNIVRIPLTPLTDADIAEHFQRIFPQVKAPEGFEPHLAQLTQGNPLFISEIVRKLVLDKKLL